ncbi:post-transcriptional regulator, partial [Faecalibacillus faecis]
DVLTVKPGDLMSFKTVEAYRSPNWFAELDEKELDALFNGERTEE